MEEWLANLLANVPLALGILLLWFLMDRSQKTLELQREQFRANDEQAKNTQIETLIGLTRTISESAVLTRETLTGVATQMTDLATQVTGLQGDNAAQFVSLQDTVAEVRTDTTLTLESVAEIQAAVKQLRTGQDTMIAALNTLCQNHVTEEVVKTLVDEVGGLRTATENLEANLAEKLLALPEVVLSAAKPQLEQILLGNGSQTAALSANGLQMEGAESGLSATMSQIDEEPAAG